MKNLFKIKKANAFSKCSKVITKEKNKTVSITLFGLVGNAMNSIKDINTKKFTITIITIYYR